MQLAVRQSSKAISYRLRVAMPLHVSLSYIKRTDISNLQWLEEEATVTVLHTGQAVTVSMVWSNAISYTATSSRQ